MCCSDPLRHRVCVRHSPPGIPQILGCIKARNYSEVEEDAAAVAAPRTDDAFGVRPATGIGGSGGNSELR
jgi:hypothetical protein